MKKFGRGYYHKDNILKIIELCNNKIEIKINTVLLKDNTEEIKKIYNLIKQYNIKRWKIFKFLSIRDAKKYSKDFSISDEISNNVEKEIKEMDECSNIKISYNKDRCYKTDYFIYPDGAIENNRLEEIGGNFLEGYNLENNKKIFSH